MIIKQRKRGRVMMLFSNGYKMLNDVNDTMMMMMNNDKFAVRKLAM